MAHGDKPYGLRDVKITNMAGDTQTDLPVARTLSFTERIKSSELSGDDALQSVISFTEAVEWQLEAGGISLAAYAALTGRTVITAGVSPAETNTLTGSGGDAMPYVKIYGKALGEGIDDIHCLLYKAKVTSLEGGFQDGEFFVTRCGGIAIDDGTNGIFDFVGNETATAVPAT